VALRSAISNQLSAISYQQSAISNQQSAISYQQSATSDQLERMNQPLTLLEQNRINRTRAELRTCSMIFKVRKIGIFGDPALGFQVTSPGGEFDAM
jgi:hypothetical protein